MEVVDQYVAIIKWQNAYVVLKERVVGADSSVWHRFSLHTPIYFEEPKMGIILSVSLHKCKCSKFTCLVIEFH